MRGCTPSFPVPESNHDSTQNEFIKCLKILRDQRLGPGYITQVHWGLQAGRRKKKKRRGWIFGSISVLLEKMILAVFWEISKWNRTFLTLSLAWPFHEEGDVKEGRPGVFVGFMGLTVRHLLCLAAGRLRIKLYMKYLSPLYQSPFNEWLQRHCTDE